MASTNFFKRKIGTSDVHCVGYGAMALSIENRPSDEKALAVLDILEDSPIQIIDTALAYCQDEFEIGHNEKLLKEFRGRSHRSDWILATKGGTWRSGKKWCVNGHPDFIRSSCESSLVNLGLSKIDLYQLHAPDPRIPIEDTIGEMKRLQTEGKIELIGVCNFSFEQLKTANMTARIDCIQNELNFFHRDDLKNGVLDYCELNSICYLAHSPVGGFLNHKKIVRNEFLKKFSLELDMTVYEILLAWLLRCSDKIIPIPGASNPDSLVSSSHVHEKIISDHNFEMLCHMIDQ